LRRDRAEGSPSAAGIAGNLIQTVHLLCTPPAPREPSLKFNEIQTVGNAENKNKRTPPHRKNKNKQNKNKTKNKNHVTG